MPRRQTVTNLLVQFLAALCILISMQRARAQEEPIAPEVPAQGEQVAHLVRIPFPLAGSADDRIRRVVTQLLTELPADANERPILVFEFPMRPESAPSSFDRCFAIARFLASDALSSVRTVAYVPTTLTGHEVLPVLACEEIIVAPDVQFGAAGKNEPNVGSTMRAAYEEIANQRRTVPSAAALAMLLPEEVLLRAETAGGVKLVLESNLAELEQESPVKSVDTIAPAGELALFTGRQMRLELGLATHLATDYAELSTALGHPLEYVNTSRLLGEEGAALRIDFTGEPTHTSVTRIIRMIAEAVARKRAGQIVLWIDSSGGSPAESMRLAQYLSQMDPAQVRTIAYVPRMASGDAVLAALACDELVLGDQAQFGGTGAREFSPGELLSFREPIKQLAADAGIGWSLPVGLIDQTLKVATYKRTDAAATRVFSEEELAEQPAGKWEKGVPLDLSGGLSAAEAVSLGLASETVGGDEEFLLLHGLPTDLQATEPNWSDTLVDALARDEVAYFMLFIAFMMLWAEVTVPGIGLPGFISAVCFAMYFWSRHLHGTAEWLEVILFVLGAVFVVVEIFVIPGWGIFGVGGGALMLAAVLLASQTFIVPTNLRQLEQMPGTLLTLLTSMAGMVVGLTLIRKLLPHTPGFNRVLLPPPEGEELEQIRAREQLVDLSRFLGQTGTTSTLLMPSGKARFGRETIDVISRGEMIERGSKVRVVEAVSNRVVVELAEEA